MPTGTILDGPSFSAVVASGTIAPSVFVQFGTTPFEVVLATGGLPSGISQEGQKYPPDDENASSTYAGVAGDLISVYGPGRTCLLTLGSAVTTGNALKPNTSGQGVPASGSVDAGAIATQSGATGDLIRVIVNIGEVA
jgi:hypothetical protein